jgi:hypothetical protein
MVLGAKQGLALAEQWNLAAMTLTRDAKRNFTEERNALYPEPLGANAASEDNIR